jgi:hypothetical protein
MLDPTAIFRRTGKGSDEIKRRSGTLEQRFRLALILCDGVRDVTELSVSMRPGEAEQAIKRLHDGGFIALASANEIPTNRVVRVAIANDPKQFPVIRQKIMGECTARLGPFGEVVAAEVESCATAIEMRMKLRDMEHFMVEALGPIDGVKFAQDIGGELTRLVPR